jgi:hypothetical protein
LSDHEGRIATAEAAIEQTLDPTAQQRREDADRDQKRRKEARRAFLIQMMQHPEGRVWLKELLDKFHAFETRFASVNGMANHAEGTWLMAGEQRCGWWLWEQLDDADPVVASRVRRGGQA